MHILTHLLVLTNLAFIFGLLISTTSTASTVTPSQNDVIMLNQIVVLNQIIRHETRHRLILEDTVKQLMVDFENLKSLQSASEKKISALTQAKADQDAMNQQLIENMTSVRVENENLKQELLTNFSNSGLHSCNCNSKNVTEELKDFKTNYRYMTLSLLDIQQKTDVMQGLSKIFVSTFFYVSAYS